MQPASKGKGGKQKGKGPTQKAVKLFKPMNMKQALQKMVPYISPAYCDHVFKDMKIQGN